MDELKKELELASDPLLGEEREYTKPVGPVSPRYNTSRVSRTLSLEANYADPRNLDADHRSERALARVTTRHRLPSPSVEAQQGFGRPFPLFESWIFRSSARLHRTEPAPLLRLLLRHPLCRRRHERSQGGRQSPSVGGFGKWGKHRGGIGTNERTREELEWYPCLGEDSAHHIAGRSTSGLFTATSHSAPPANVEKRTQSRVSEACVSHSHLSESLLAHVSFLIAIVGSSNLD